MIVPCPASGAAPRWSSRRFPVRQRDRRAGEGVRVDLSLARLVTIESNASRNSSNESFSTPFRSDEESPRSVLLRDVDGDAEVHALAPEADRLPSASA